MACYVRRKSFFAAITLQIRYKWAITYRGPTNQDAAFIIDHKLDFTKYISIFIYVRGVKRMETDNKKYKEA